MTSRRMVPGPIATTDALLAAARGGSSAVGGMPGSLNKSGVVGDGRWFLDGEGYIGGRDESWTLDASGGVTYRLTFFDGTERPAWELAAESSAGRSAARTATAGARLRTVAIGVAVVAGVIALAYALRKVGG